MTKINKLGKSTFVIAILSFILVAVLAFGGTYAYFSDTANEVTTGEITLGTLKFAAGATYAETVELVGEDTFVVPNQYIMNGKASVAVDSNITYYVRAIVDVKFALDENHTCDTEGEDAICTAADVLLQENKTAILYTIKDSAGKTILGQDASGAVTADSTDWFAVTNAVDNKTYLYLADPVAAADGNETYALDILAQVNPLVGDGESQHFMGSTFEITVKFQVCQADYVGSSSPDNASTGLATTLDKDTVETSSAWKTLGLIPTAQAG